MCTFFKGKIRVEKHYNLHDLKKHTHETYIKY